MTTDAIPFLDLKAQQARIADELRRRLDGVLAHCQFILGPEVAELEAELARFCGASAPTGRRMAKRPVRYTASVAVEATVALTMRPARWAYTSSLRSAVARP